MKKITINGIFVIIECAYMGLLFLIPYNHTIAFGVIVGYSLLSAVMVLAVLNTSLGDKKGQDKFVDYFFLRVSIVFLAIQYILGLIMAGVAQEHLRIIIFFLTAIILLYIIVILFGHSVKRQTPEETEKSIQAKAYREYAKICSSVLVRVNNENTKRQLLELEERFKYGNPISSDLSQVLDNNIKTEMNTLLQTNDEGEINCICIKITDMIDKRENISL